jgi:hypothetical protein
MNTNTHVYALCPSDDICRNISQNIKEKILTDAYIDFSVLLENAQSINNQFPQQQKHLYNSR